MKLTFSLLVALLISAAVPASSTSKTHLPFKLQIAEGLLSAATQEPDEAKLNAEITRLYNEGKYEEGLPLAKQLLALREKQLGPGDLLVATALNKLASFYTAKAENTEAHTLLQRSLKIIEGAKGPDDLALVPVLNQLADLDETLDLTGERETLLERAVSIREKSLGADAAGTLESISRLADYYESTWNYEKAQALWAKILDVKRNTPDDKIGLLRAQLKCRCLQSRSKRPTNVFELDREGLGSLVVKDSKYANEREQVRIITGGSQQKSPSVYPTEAKRSRVGRKVFVNIIVDESGMVVGACAVSGPQDLWHASEKAAYQARFQPTVLKGKPVKVFGQIMYNFVLR